MCQMHTKSDKPQTKLTILQQAVQVIMTMELELRGKHSTVKHNIHQNCIKEKNLKKNILKNDWKMSLKLWLDHITREVRRLHQLIRLNLVISLKMNLKKRLEFYHFDQFVLIG